MNRRDDEGAAVRAALDAAGIGQAIASIDELSGGCIHRVLRLALGDGRTLVAKINRAHALALFQEEVTGLRALAATGTLIVPQPLAAIAHSSHAVLLMTFIEPPLRTGDDQMWRRFGEDLAALHLAPLSPGLARGYGFSIDNHLGTSVQPNTWCADWVRFNAEHRLGHQLRLARDGRLLSASDAQSIESVIDRLHRLLPPRPRPSLLHGDLWSGNALPCRAPNEEAGATCAIIDPAPYVGDALADIAMMQLFGGFPHSCFDAWAQRTGVDLHSDDAERQIAVYQLYQVLNHVNIFGGGYAGRAMAIVSRLA